MTTPPIFKPSDMCDCYYIADKGSYKQAYQGTGCNVVNIKGIDRIKVPECTAEILN